MSNSISPTQPQTQINIISTSLHHHNNHETPTQSKQPITNTPSSISPSKHPPPHPQLLISPPQSQQTPSQQNPQSQLLQNKIKQEQAPKITSDMVSPCKIAKQIVNVVYDKRNYEVQIFDGITVMLLKKNIEKITNVDVDKQIILFNDVFLDDERLLADYAIQDGDHMAMGKINQQGTNSTKQILITQKINHLKLNSRHRRGSQGQSKKQQQQIEVVISKFTNSVVEIPSNSYSNQRQRQRQRVFSSQKYISKHHQLGNVFNTTDSQIFDPVSSQITEENNQEFQVEGCLVEEIDVGDCVNVMSEDGGSPFIKDFMQQGKKLRNFQTQAAAFTNMNIFKQKNPFDIKALQFGDENDEFRLDKFEADIEQALQQVKKQVIFCQSYYEKETIPIQRQKEQNKGHVKLTYSQEYQQPNQQDNNRTDIQVKHPQNQLESKERRQVKGVGDHDEKPDILSTNQSSKTVDELPDENKDSSKANNKQSQRCIEKP